MFYLCPNRADGKCSQLRQYIPQYVLTYIDREGWVLLQNLFFWHQWRSWSSGRTTSNFSLELSCLPLGTQGCATAQKQGFQRVWKSFKVTNPVSIYGYQKMWVGQLKFLSQTEGGKLSIYIQYLNIFKWRLDPSPFWHGRFCLTTWVKKEWLKQTGVCMQVSGRLITLLTRFRVFQNKTQAVYLRKKKMAGKEELMMDDWWYSVTRNV